MPGLTHSLANNFTAVFAKCNIVTIVAIWFRWVSETEEQNQQFGSLELKNKSDYQ